MLYTNSILKFNKDNFPKLHPLKEGFLLQMIIDLATRGGKIESEIFAEKLYFAQRMGEGKNTAEYQRQYVNKMIKLLIDNGYIESVEGCYHKVKGRNFHTSKWVLSEKTIDIIKKNIVKNKSIKNKTTQSKKAAQPQRVVPTSFDNNNQGMFVPFN